LFHRRVSGSRFMNAFHLRRKMFHYRNTETPQEMQRKLC